MDEATIVFSRIGILARTISARQVTSREHARKLWPLVTTEEPRTIVTWVRPTFDDAGALKRRSHFRRLSGFHEVPFSQIFEQEESARQKASKESAEHSTAKMLVAAALQARLQDGRAMPWSFSDQDASDFHLSGNLLLGAAEVSTEHKVRTAFGSTYRLDVGILSKTIRKGPILLGGIEIELGHAFDGRKALMGKSLAFPLISIDITGMTLAELTPEWADLALTETTRDSEKHRRKTYVYLHDVLYPQYIQVPVEHIGDHRHQFIVFAEDAHLQKLRVLLPLYQRSLALPDGVLSLSVVNAKSSQATTMLTRLGNVVGPDWADVNNHGCLLLTVNRPGPFDEALHTLHLCMANLLLSFTDSLVGYSYRRDMSNNTPEDDIWVHQRWNPASKKFDLSRIAPKRLAEPRSRLIHWLGRLEA